MALSGAVNPINKPVNKPTPVVAAAAPAPVVPAKAPSAIPSVPVVSAPMPSANNPFIARDLDFASDWLSALYYGDFGVGKTFLAGSAALVDAYSDVLYIALEGG